MNLSITKQDNKFVVLQNGVPIVLPDMPYEFISLEDAIRAIDIIKTQNYVTNILKGYGL